jgi:exodeoxyribonuclease V alpha subunit
MKQYKIKVTSLDEGETHKHITALVVNDELEHTSDLTIRVKAYSIKSTLINNSYFSLWVDDFCDTSNPVIITGLVIPLSLKHKESLVPFSYSDIPKALIESKKYSLNGESIDLIYTKVKHLHDQPERLLTATYEALKELRLPTETIHSYAALILQTSFLHTLMPHWPSEQSYKKLLAMITSLSNRLLLSCWKKPMLLATRFRVITGNDMYNLLLKANSFSVSKDYEEHINALAIDAILSVEKKLSSIFYPFDDIVTMISKYFYTYDVVKNALLAESIGDILFIADFKGEKYIARKSEVEKEKYIFSKLALISSNTNSKVNTICNNDRLLEKFLKSEHVTLNCEQDEVFKSLLCSPVSLLTGEPGTGKTFISMLFIRYIEQCLRVSSDDVLLLSPTGIVAQRLATSSGMEAKTMHRSMRVYIDEETNELVISDPDVFKAKLILVDECSMPNLNMFYSFCKCLPIDSKIILVGDPDQLPSIGTGKIFSDLIKSSVFPLTHLSNSRRSSHNGSININAKKITSSPNNFVFIEDDNSKQIEKDSNESVFIAAQEVIKSKLSKNGYDASSLVVLSPWHKEKLGTVSINKFIQDLLLEYGSLEKAPSYKNNQNTFFVGDHVIVSMNDYKRDIYNGDIGIVTMITTDLRQKDILHVLIRDQKITFTRGQAEYLDLAYCMTPHKMQGSEIENVVVVIPDNSHFMLSREWMLTAMTRAKYHCTVISTPEAPNRICKKSSKNKRITLMDLRGHHA